MTDQQHAFSRFWRLRGLAGLELMRARYLGHVFARHGHETFAVGVVQDGHEEIWFRGGTERVGPGGLVFINPEEVHTGVALTDRGWAYRVLYPLTGRTETTATAPMTPGKASDSEEPEPRGTLAVTGTGPRAGRRVGTGGADPDR